MVLVKIQIAFHRKTAYFFGLLSLSCKAMTYTMLIVSFNDGAGTTLIMMF